jgi:hypothetical protein
MKRSFVGSLSLAAALLAACGGSDKTPQLDLARFTDRFADRVCSAMVECSCADASALADCKTAYSQELTFFLTVEGYSPGQKIDPVAAEACLAELQSSMNGCPSPTSGLNQSMMPAHCDPKLFLVGTQAAGEYCNEGQDCAPGLYCDTAHPGAWACAELPGLEEPCVGPNSLCGAGFYCSDLAGSLCEPTPGPGDSCNADDAYDGLHDEYVDPCQAGTTCAATDDGMKCVAPHELGTECSDGAGCVAGTFCQEPVDALPATCVAQLADGAECGDDAECLHGWCAGGTCADVGFCNQFGGNR